MENEQIKAWVTKYALTKKIELVDAEVCHDISSAMIKYGTAGYGLQFAHGKDWHRTPEAALTRVEEMRSAKITSLQKSIARMRALIFIACPTN